LRELFTNIDWTKTNDYPFNQSSTTPWGVVEFGDGVQTWINPRLQVK
jgi:hypothetical protein